MRATGLKSTSSVAYQLQNLRKKGLITYRPGVSRSIRLANPAAAPAPVQEADKWDIGQHPQKGKSPPRKKKAPRQRNDSGAPITRGGNSYDAVHSRVKRLWGSAGGHLCVICGFTAQQWAYNGRDSAEVQSRRFNGHGSETLLTYSLNAEFYIPMCIPCHGRFDAAKRAA
jgi:hypothetical protein